ncbi:GNAT family N-acetyltransferase [Streptomyces pactum]|uniref:GNAT family N-acetyltransferase n=1 Tax=Streptomyces pactum TaxID=68249 RepID=A0ABS0NRR3_9ACTN|nr:GNAT family N-acetyltransferase [Streptomyces pactum]MBH5337905.1 GNAT family N-acetyltransferase [Streptomyces pactum]
MTPTFPDISINTDRLVLRPFTESDVPELTEMMNDELVTAWTSVPHPYTAADAREWITRTAPAERLEGRGIVFAVTEFLTQRLVGSVRLCNTDWRCLTSEVAYLTAPWARGEGYAAESVLAVAGWLFGDQKFERLELRTPADNAAAQQVAQKIGCISEGVLRNAWIARARPDDDPHGRWTDVRTDLIVWSLLPEDLESGAGEPAGGSGYTSYPDWS